MRGLEEYERTTYGIEDGEGPHCLVILNSLISHYTVFSMSSYREY